MPWTAGPTPEADDALDLILQAAQQIVDPMLRNRVLPYVQNHVASCRANANHPWGPPAPLGCQPPANPNNHHANPLFGDDKLTTDLVGAAGKAQGAQTAAAWCLVIFDLDHAGGGGDNTKGNKSYRPKKKGNKKKSKKSGAEAKAKKPKHSKPAKPSKKKPSKKKASKKGKTP